MKKTKLVVCYHFGRSGSTLLSDCLSQNSKIDSASELFTLLSMKGIKSEQMNLQTVLAHIEQKRIHSKKEFLYLEIKPMNFIGSNRCGFLKLHKQLAHYHQAKTLYLRRNNVLKRVISSDKAAKIGIYHLDADAKEKKNSNSIFLNLHEGYDYDARLFYVDLIDRLQMNIALERKVINRLKKDAIDFKIINYEDNLRTKKALKITIDQLTDWLSIKREEFKVNLKQTSRGLRSDVKNFADMERLLRKSDYSHFLE